MNRPFIAVGVALTLSGCQPTGEIPPIDIAQSQAVLILQCDGHIETIGDPNGRTEQRRTYRVDTFNHEFAEWSADSREWFRYTGRLDVSPSSFQFNQTDNYASYVSEKSAVFDRQAGNLTYRDDMTFKDGDVARVRFIAACTQVDKPSPDVRF